MYVGGGVDGRVGECGRVCSRGCRWRPEVTHGFEDRTSQNLELASTTRLAGEDLTVCTSPTLGSHEHTAAPALSMWVPGIEAMSSSLHGKHTSNYAIAPTLTLLCLIIFQSHIWLYCGKMFPSLQSNLGTNFPCVHNTVK